MASQYVKGGVADVITKSQSQKKIGKPSALQALFSQQHPENVTQRPAFESPKPKKEKRENKEMREGVTSKKKTSPKKENQKKKRKHTDSILSTEQAKKDTTTAVKKQKLMSPEGPVITHTKFPEETEENPVKKGRKLQRENRKKKKRCDEHEGRTEDSIHSTEQAKKDTTTAVKKQKLMSPEGLVITHTKFPEETEENPVKKGRKSQRENRKKKKRCDERERRTVFVGNLPKMSTKTSLQQLFKKYGTIESVRFRSAAPADLKLSKKAVITTKAFSKNRHTLNGYVVFVDIESAKKALESNGALHEGIHLRVDMAKNSNKVDNKRSVFIGNLPFDAEEEEVREHFEDCGTIENVRIVRDGRTGLGKGFGYILFESQDGVTLAQKLHEKKFKSRILRVQNCVEKGKNSSSEFNREKRQKPGKPGVKQRPGTAESGPLAKDGKRQQSGRSMPSNASSKDFQGFRAKQFRKIKKKQKQKGLKMKKKEAKTLSLGQKPTENKAVLARNRIAKKMRIKK